MIAGMMVNDEGLMVFLIFLICSAVVDLLVHLSERHLRTFHIAMIVLSLLLAGYVCYCKWHQANARLEQTREVQP